MRRLISHIVPQLRLFQTVAAKRQLIASLLWDLSRVTMWVLSSVVCAMGNSLKAVYKAWTPGSLSFALVCSSQILVGSHILILL